MVGYISGALLGLGLGANDAGNVFGTAVGSRMIRFRTAAVLGGLFVAMGAVLQGSKGIHTLKSISASASASGSITILAAALTVAAMTWLKLPTSTSQAVVGAILGVGLLQRDVSFAPLFKVVVCWVTTPVGALLIYVILDRVFRRVLRRMRFSIFTLDPILRAGLIVCGCYGAYALGANNVANVAAVFVGPEMLTAAQATLFGGVSIAAGVFFLSRPVMLTIGRGLVQMDAFSAFVAVLSQAITVHIYAMVGVPVSSSQAIVGAVLGISLVKGLHIVRVRMLRNVLLAWLLTPLLAGAAAAALSQLGS